MSKARMLAVVDAVSKIDFSGEFVSITVPTLVLCGSRDRANLPAAHALPAAFLVPSCASSTAPDTSPTRRHPSDSPPPSTSSVDIRAALPGFTPPTLVISGERDIRTPREVADEIVDTAPNATLLPVRDHGHSALDTAPHIALAAIDRLTHPENVTDDLTARRSAMARLLTARMNLARILPKSLS